MKTNLKQIFEESAPNFASDKRIRNINELKDEDFSELAEDIMEDDETASYSLVADLLKYIKKLQKGCKK